LHSIAKFADAEGPEELSGKIFGFYGERTKYGPPAPLMLPEKNAWEWNKKAKFVPGAIAWKTWLGQAGNEKKLWAPDAAAAVEKEMPRMIQVPARVAIYAMEAPRTAGELYEFINELTMDEESELENTDTEFVKQWLVAAGQKDSGVALELQTPVTQDETFREWAVHILNANLGPEEQAPTSPQEQGQQQHGADMHMAHAGVQQQLNMMAHLMVQQESNRQFNMEAGKKKSKTVYTKYTVARLLGWAGVTQYNMLPPIWNQFLESDDPDDHRDMLTERMKVWFEARGKRMPMGIYFTREQLKLITAAKFAPGGPVGILASADSGVTNLGCLPRSYAEIQAIKKYEAAADEARNNLTLRDVQKEQKGQPIVPPSTHAALLSNIEVTCAMVHSLVGKNDLYNKLLQIYVVLSSEYTEALSENFNGELCRDYSWAIMEEMCAFFNQRSAPEEFMRGCMVLFPTSTMSEVITQMRYVKPCKRRTYPVEWRILDNKEAQTRSLLQSYNSRGGGAGTTGGNGFGGASGGGGTGGALVGAGGSGRSAGGNQAQRGSGENQGGGGENNTQHIHPMIAKVMAPLWKAVGHSLLINDILAAAGIRRTDLPTWRPAMQGDRNMLCYNFVCGVCRFGNRCTFQHVLGATLGDGFANEFAQKVKIGVDYLAKNPPVGAQGGAKAGAAGGSPKKRSRQE
jgi:hypothetical protein